MNIDPDYQTKFEVFLNQSFQKGSIGEDIATKLHSVCLNILYKGGGDLVKCYEASPLKSGRTYGLTLVENKEINPNSIGHFEVTCESNCLDDLYIKKIQFLINPWKSIRHAVQMQNAAVFVLEHFAQRDWTNYLHKAIKEIPFFQVVPVQIEKSGPEVTIFISVFDPLLASLKPCCDLDLNNIKAIQTLNRVSRFCYHKTVSLCENHKKLNIKAEAFIAKQVANNLFRMVVVQESKTGGKCHCVIYETIGGITVVPKKKFIGSVAYNDLNAALGSYIVMFKEPKNSDKHYKKSFTELHWTPQKKCQRSSNMELLVGVVAGFFRLR